MKVISIQDGKALGKIKMEERQPSVLRDDELRIKWHASSLNFHDYLVAIGGIVVPKGRIPMSDGAGEVIEKGKDVHEFNIGDRVMSLFFPAWQEGNASFSKIAGITGESIDGCLCEESCLPAQYVTRIPKAFSYAEAACLPTAALTSWNAIMHTAPISFGQSLMVQGTGGMSMFALLFAMAAGVEVYASTSSEEKSERLKSLDVSGVVNYKEDMYWGKSIFKMSGGGVDQLIDVGGGSTMKQSMEAIKIGGHIHAIGILGDGRKGEITFPKLFFKFIKMEGLAVGSKEMQNRMVKALDLNPIKPIIDKSFGFDQLTQAFEYQMSGKQFGKIVLEW